MRYEKDSWGNKVGYIEIQNPTREQVAIKEEFDLTRSEVRKSINPADSRPLTEEEKKALFAYLQPSTHVIVNDDIKKLAASIIGGETNPVIAARRLYDWTYKNVNYWVKDPDHLKASPVGSAEYCLRTKTGNCTDFHSLFASLAISSGISTRMIYGSLLKPTLNGMEIDGSYHCWIEFFAPRLGWLPLDASLANIYAEEIHSDEKNKKLVELITSTGYHGADKSKVEYYFGNLDERRVVWSKVLIPQKALLEIGSLLTKSSAESIHFAENDSTLFFVIGKRLLTARRLAGTFPNYEAVLPRDNNTAVVIGRDELRTSVMRVAQFADERSNAIRLRLEKNELKLASSTVEAGESEDVLQVRFNGDPTLIGFNAHYLLDFLKVLDTEHVRLEFKSTQIAMECKPEDSASSDYRYRYVVMPVRI